MSFLDHRGAPAGRLDRRSVLVIVPRPDVRRAAAQFWSDAGFDVDAVATARAARERLAAKPAPSVIVIDLTSSWGRTLLAAIRGREAHRHTPIISLVRNKAVKVHGVFASVSRPMQLAPWLRIYERLEERTRDEEELVAVRPAA